MFKKNYRTNLTSNKIDINSIYNKMQNQLRIRANLQVKYDNLWDVIKRNHCDRHYEMQDLNSKIGKCTNELNKLIGQLCKYKKTHKAMNLAYSYIESEMERINRIIQHQNRVIYDVNHGYRTLINSYGHEHTNTSDLRNYVNYKMQQYNKLNNWKQYVARYRVS